MPNPPPRSQTLTPYSVGQSSVHAHESHLVDLWSTIHWLKLHANDHENMSAEESQKTCQFLEEAKQRLKVDQELWQNIVNLLSGEDSEDEDWDIRTAARYSRTKKPWVWQWEIAQTSGDDMGGEQQRGGESEKAVP